MKYYMLVCFLLISVAVQAQEETDTSTPTEEPNPWTKSWVLSLTGNQAEYNDWSPGGVNSTAFVASSLFKAKYTGTKFANETTVNLRFGQVNQEGNGVDKTEDLIRIVNKTDYFIHKGTWSAFVEFAFRTQFTEGFDESSGDLISDFLSPGYFTESLGISYQPTENFNTQLGLGLKQTIVEVDGLDQFYGLGEDEDVRKEGGLTFALKYKKELFKNFTYETELYTFSNLLIPFSSTDVNMTNIFTGQINSFLTSMLEISFIYDDDFDTVLQNMRVISMGVRVEVF